MSKLLEAGDFEPRDISQIRSFADSKLRQFPMAHIMLLATMRVLSPSGLVRNSTTSWVAKYWNHEDLFDRLEIVGRASPRRGFIYPTLRFGMQLDHNSHDPHGIKSTKRADSWLQFYGFTMENVAEIIAQEYQARRAQRRSNPALSDLPDTLTTNFLGLVGIDDRDFVTPKEKPQYDPPDQPTAKLVIRNGMNEYRLLGVESGPIPLTDISLPYLDTAAERHIRRFTAGDLVLP